MLELSVHHHILIERLHAMVVESKVHIAQRGRVSLLQREHKSRIVKRTVKLIHFGPARILGSDIGKPERRHHFITAINAYTCGVSAYSRNISSQGSQSSSHANKPCRSIQIATHPAV